MNDRESYLIEVSTRMFEQTQLFQLSVVGRQNIQQRARELKRALGPCVISSREFASGSSYQMTLVVRDGPNCVVQRRTRGPLELASFVDVEQLVRVCAQRLGNAPLMVDPIAVPAATHQEPLGGPSVAAI